MTEEDYSGVVLVKNAWPEWRPVGDGAFVRRWKFELERALQEDFLIPDDLGDDDIEVTVSTGERDTELIATTATRQNAWSDQVFFFAFHRLFERMEERFGRLKSIQGQPRDEWPPFRRRDGRV